MGKLSHKKSFSSKAKESKVTKNQGDTTFIERPCAIISIKQEENYPPEKNPFEEDDSGCGSPRIGVRTQSSNLARDTKHPKPTQQTSDPFVLGKEPSVKPSMVSKNNNKNLHKQQEFFPITHLTEKEKNNLIEMEKHRKKNDTKNLTSDQNDYEDVNVFKKRTKKKKKKNIL